jgi:hypothetical protein
MVFKLQTRKRSDSGTLGIAVRSTGYLQGGYKDATIHSKVQLFNTVTQVGSIVTDTGYARSYTPGVSGNMFGYYSINDTTNFNKFSYIGSTSAASFSIGAFAKTTAFDFGVFSQAWVLAGTASAGWTGGTDTSNWFKVNLSADTAANNGALSTTATGTTRQGLNTGQMAGFMDSAASTFQVLSYASSSVTTSISHASLNVTAMQIPCGMAKDQSLAYFVGIGVNLKVTISGTSVTAIAVSTAYGYNFGESHSVTSDVAGFMMAGYNDTSGKYGGTQHGLCQKITFSGEAITTLSDLVLAQSSGQMMQGF